MRSILTALTIIVLAFILGPMPAEADDPDVGDAALKERFLKEYPKAAERLRKAYSQVHGSGLETSDQIQAGQLMRSSKLLTDFHIDGDSFKTTARWQGKEVPKWQPFFLRTTCWTTTFGYFADRKAEDTPPVLKPFPPDRLASYRRSVDAFRNDYFNAPFFSISPIDEQMKEPSFKIVRAIALERDGKQLVEIKYTRDIKIGKVQYATNETILLSPVDSWALMESKIAIDDGLRTSKVEYGPSVDGIPTIKRVTRESRNLFKQVFEFKELQFGPTPAEAFKP